ncbi:MAG: DNA polymerase III subunit beta [Pseudomonadota bacterium]|nr:DNA polymerase III subunit beta [Pseudomonadota bacterium]
MKVNVKALRGALKAINLIVEKRNTIPVLQHVLIQSTPAQMTLTGTDLDLQVTKVVDLEEPGKNKALSICVDAATLASIAGKLPAEGIADIDRGEKGQVAISCGRARFKLPTLPAEDLPLIPSPAWEAQWEQQGGELTAMLHGVAFAASSEEARYYLNGVYLHVPADSECQVAAATDGHRLARFHVPVAEGAEAMPAIIVPTKAVKALMSIMDEESGEVGVSVSAGKFQFEVGQTMLLGKVIEGQFPDYTRVIPVGNKIDAWFEPAPLAEAVERVLTISMDKTRALALEFMSDRVVLTVNSPENGTATEEVPIDLTGDSVRIGFNGRYLLDVLAQLKGTGADGVKARVLLNSHDEPTLWQQSDEARATYVLMPMRV